MGRKPLNEANRKVTAAKFLKAHFKDGELDAKSVLDLARPKSSPIHNYFTWEDTKAAEAYRLMQARQLISCVVVEIKGVEVRKYTTPVVVNDTGDKYYVDVQVARKAPDIWAQVLDRALADLVSWKQRYGNLKELSLVHRAI